MSRLNCGRGLRFEVQTQIFSWNWHQQSLAVHKLCHPFIKPIDCKSIMKNWLKSTLHYRGCINYLTIVYIRPGEVVKGYISSSSRIRSISWAVFCTQLNLLAALLYSSCILSMSRAKLTRRFTASIRSLTIGNCGNSLSGIRYNHCFYFHINKKKYTLNISIWTDFFQKVKYLGLCL